VFSVAETLLTPPIEFRDSERKTARAVRGGDQYDRKTPDTGR
jgi:hypothetical protein